MSEEKSSAEQLERIPEEAVEPDCNVQTLTDLFDQLDRAAFKRVLDSRDSFAAPRNRPAKSG